MFVFDSIAWTMRAKHSCFENLVERKTNVFGIWGSPEVRTAAGAPILFGSAETLLGLLNLVRAGDEEED